MFDIFFEIAEHKEAA